ncbi:DNA polymerase-4 [Desulfonatronum thiosulfatophilum]|uniref:DNA polymerase IV n=1 Tax=Desulfonatronum thiosulfatophilum TaxID=617002 RepID=A0A1G6CH85_9BACT|nr:DNA polymerase IV [Desulfonatronum thiosulfatophilum]SDB32191.1 DNA polymerase-4 [Desulfonatronum thiosulfatophilum]
MPLQTPSNIFLPTHSALILHVDMDAFFASVEQLDFPELRGKPVIVGGSERGVVSACSYEARRYGVHSAMPMFKAKRLCPHGVFVPGRMRRYGEASRDVMAVLERFSPLVEQASVDEAYLDVSGQERIFGPPEQLGTALKLAVLEATGLRCSVGMAPVKFLAKIASDQDKPDGLFIIRPDQVQAFLSELPISKIPGVGPRAVEKLAVFRIRTAGDAQRFSEEFWRQRFGKWGEQLFDRARGIDPRRVVREYEAKSEGAENTFAEDTDDREELKRWLLDQAERVGRRLRRDNHKGRTVTLKLKYNDFKSITRARTLGEATNATRVIFETAASLLESEELVRKVRLIGVSVSNFSNGPCQLPLFQAPKARVDETLDRTLDAIRDKFGQNAMVRGRIFDFRRKS